MKQGYKQTEVGVIPEDWEDSTIGAVFNITAGGDVDPKRSQSYRDESHPYPIYSNALTNYGLYGYCAYADHPAGSITVTARGMVGAANFREHAYTAIGRVLVLQPKGDIAGLYFSETINSRVKFANESTGVPQLTAPQISKYKLPAPPYVEQRAIAAALSDVDGLLGALDRLIAKKRDLKQGAMQKLLTGLTRLPGFNGEWEERLLGECAYFRTGPFGSALHKSDYTVDGIPVVNPMHINDGRIEPTRTMTIKEEVAKKLADFRLKAGEIIIGRRGDMGRCAVVTVEQVGWLCGTGCMLIRGGATDANFLQRVLSSPPVIAAIEETSVGSTMINLNQGTLARLKLKFPPYLEQSAIAEVMGEMEAELTALEQRLEKTRALKQGMMQELLTGRTRLV